MTDLEGKRVLIVGLGASGYAAAELLAKKGAEIKISEQLDGVAVRQRLDLLAPYGVKAQIGMHTADFCGDVDLVVVSPGVDSGSPALRAALKEGVPVIGEMELGFSLSPATMIAITGTNGKTTTTELIGRIMTVSGKHTIVCGNIGNPLTGEISKLTPDSVAVVEVSSFQLETIKKFKPRVAILLNVTEDHYDRHGNIRKYKGVKFKIFENQDESDWAVLNASFREDPLLSGVRSRKVFFGLSGKEDAFVQDGWLTVRFGDEISKILKWEGSLIEGAHNMENVACAALAAKIMGVSDQFIREGIMTFRGLGHRFERLGTFRGIEYIDDSKGTNIDATRRALESLEKKVVLIAGGRDKGGDYSSVVDVVKDKVKTMVLIGEAQEKMKKTFSSAVPVVLARNMKDAVRIASASAASGDAVLLSPMCSSFDMFSSYKERGEVFQREVKEFHKFPGIFPRS
ncbi:MAG: UDP-N-acetylmuramoyl-L-alanine--D-glutamate ligase [Candidatus Omnitrophica bacterium]|jgi:UDP-N-acetylmuramoylalanine--D-glutamate ligase|nr:UDP-N-acetylmuramoyl-L-alanine--D-glutamate ligase [Candidatus Omnitrophota bacterium]MDD4012734.1 UDP-N-acetylmuramoyl-L-alanine--D-glutamate ligase [Candidatus Omnitrophota bacterium]